MVDLTFITCLTRTLNWKERIILLPGKKKFPVKSIRATKEPSFQSIIVLLIIEISKIINLHFVLKTNLYLQNYVLFH